MFFFRHEGVFKIKCPGVSSKNMFSIKVKKKFKQNQTHKKNQAKKST